MLAGAGPNEQLFLGGLGGATADLACRWASVRSGGLVGGLLCSLWLSEGVAPSSLGAAAAAASGGRSCCTLLCRDVPEAGISQLSVRRRDDSCIRLVATTAFMAA